MIVKQQMLKCSTSETALLVMNTNRSGGTVVHRSIAMFLYRQTENSEENTECSCSFLFDVW